MVTLNYRVGVLGFFSTGDEVCRGNFGLWDQTLALKWVQKHIASFGGNPNNVTIFGQSAGGVSVDLLSLSPHSRDLFHRVVPMSGNALCEFGCRTAKGQRESCLGYLRHIGYSGSEDSKEIMDWLKTKPIEEMEKMNGYVIPVTGVFVYEPNIDGDFLSKPLDELRREAPKKAIMLGVAEHEGLFFEFLGQDSRPTEEILKSGIEALYKEDTGPDFLKVREKIFNFYTKDTDRGNEVQMKERLIEFFGDALFNGGAIATAQAALTHGNTVWFYVFDYCSPNGFGGLEEMMPFVGPTHCTDLRYVLGEGLYSAFQPNEEEWKMIDKMTTLYTNFAKYGNPNGQDSDSAEWEPYSLATPERHYRIGYPRGGMRNEYHKGRWAFLSEIRANNKILEEVVYGRL
uniref:Carboxylic ester hydrolase n=1 Tax=Caenorhabditis japonica TaxID=281687 RepID=A0A8R1EIX4_CAEJA